MPSDERQERDAASWSPIDSHEWYAARNAVSALRDVLVAAGMERDFPYLRADVNAFGHGFIDLGRISPETAERLAGLVRRAVAMGCEVPCAERSFDLSAGSQERRDET
ncbi:hypothetical protein [Streptomyces sp. CBMA29]|uniref:hypothetical protein n=1 Tax=Streptomyces sp. CBMA29 TaxID=1896314 RepID=UPI001CB75395|nr:hypothetical protein [Streptomyces sp. CBMA29]MBD0736444.1 hypothetical protein [Streptomyces sp. CBMA29]